MIMRAPRRVIEQARCHLDLRHPAAVAHLDETIDFLVGELGVGYLKLDYNITVSPGTEGGGLGRRGGDAGTQPRPSALAGPRAGPASGTHDRELRIGRDADGLRPAVPPAAAVHQRPAGLPALSADRGGGPGRDRPGAIGGLGLCQPGFSDDKIAFTLCSAMLGRIHLSGHLDKIRAGAERDLVAQAVQVYKAIRSDLAHAVPFLAARPAQVARSRGGPGPAGPPRHVPGGVAPRAPGRDRNQLRTRALSPCRCRT